MAASTVRVTPVQRGALLAMAAGAKLYVKGDGGLYERLTLMALVTAGLAVHVVETWGLPGRRSLAFTITDAGRAHLARSSR